MNSEHFDIASAIVIVPLWLIFGVIFRFKCFPLLFQSLFSTLDDVRVRLFSQPPAAASSPLEKWWANELSLEIAQTVHESSDTNVEEWLRSRHIIMSDGETPRSLASMHAIEERKTLFNEAMADYFQRKRQGMKDYAGEMPHYHPVLGLQGWWLELTDSEQDLLCSLLYVLCTHIVTSALFMVALVCDVSQITCSSLLRMGSAISWAGNVADLVTALVSTRVKNSNIIWNFNGARRLSSLVFHHIAAIITIPLFLWSDIRIDIMLSLAFLLEWSGGVALIITLLSISPLRTTKEVYGIIVTSLFTHLLAMRWWCWIIVCFGGTMDSIHRSLSNYSFLSIVITAITFVYFNELMVMAYYRRVVAIMSLAFGSVVTQYPSLEQFCIYIDRMMRDEITRKLFAFVAPLTICSWHYLSTRQSMLVSLIFAVSFLFVLSRRSRKTVSGGIGTKKTKSRKDRKEYTSYEMCSWLLKQESFSPTPYRYRHPPPELETFAQWAKAMLLYNDLGHLRLKHSYPPLNRPKHVHSHYQEIVNQEIDILLCEAGVDENSKGSILLDLMPSISIILPWRVIRHITGIPYEDISEAASLIRRLGEFVGRPFSVDLAQDALKAKAQMSILINKWIVQWTKSNASGTIITGVFPYWLKQAIFPRRMEFDANVVMFLFAGTHNLENVLGHAIRLLLSHPEQLELLRSDPALLSNVTNETLRFCPAIRVLPRTALIDTTLPDGETVVEEGETVLLHIFQANRDENVHENPHVFDISRSTSYKHLGFGCGTHRCNGSSLAKLQIESLVKVILLNDSWRVALADPTHTYEWSHTYSHLQHLQLELVPCNTQKLLVLYGDDMTISLQNLSFECRSISVTRMTIESFLASEEYITANWDFTFVTDPSLTPSQLLEIRNAIGVKCFKIAVRTVRSASSAISSFWELKKARYNMVLAVPQREPSHWVAITPECGMINLPADPIDRLSLFTKLVSKRQAVTWFQTHILEEGTERPCSLSAYSDARSRAELLLELAHTGSLFTKAVDVQSGNISCKLLDAPDTSTSVLVSQRQVDKSKMCVAHFNVATVNVASRRIACWVAPGIERRKSSIDTGTQSLLYRALPWIHSIIHFHYSNAIVLCDCKTDFPYPCGVVEEAVEVLRVWKKYCSSLSEEPQSMCLEMLHHGYIIALSTEGVQNVIDEWNAARKVVIDTFSKLDSASDDCDVFPIFDRARCCGAQLRFTGSEHVPVCLITLSPGVSQTMQHVVFSDVAHRGDYLLDCSTEQYDVSDYFEVISDLPYQRPLEKWLLREDPPCTCSACVL